MTPPEITVRQVMDLTPVTVTPDATVQHVLGLMNQRRIGSVLVVKDGLQLAGIFTERDLLKRVASAVPGWRDYPVSDWMTEKPHTIEPDIGWDEAVGRMHKLRVRHLPVVENGEVIGIISTRLLMSRRAEYLNQKIEERTAELHTAFDQLMIRVRAGEVVVVATEMVERRVMDCPFQRGPIRRRLGQQHFGL